MQSLARYVMTDAMLAYMTHPISRIAPIVHTVHDEVILVAPEDRAHEALGVLQAAMRTPPSWWPELVTHSEGGVGRTYGDTKKT